MWQSEAPLSPRTGPQLTCHTRFSSLHAIRKVPFLAIVVFDLDQTMDVGLETRALLVELTGELEVIDDLLVEDLARDQERNARWVRRDQTDSDTAFQAVYFHPFCLALGNVGIGI